MESTFHPLKKKEEEKFIPLNSEEPNPKAKYFIVVLELKSSP